MMTRSLTIAATAFLSLAAVSTAEAGPRNGSGCPKWVCGDNGTSLNGIETNGVRQNGRALKAINGAIKSVVKNGIALDGRAVPATADEPTVNAVVLPSGETVDLR